MWIINSKKKARETRKKNAGKNVHIFSIENGLATENK